MQTLGSTSNGLEALVRDQLNDPGSVKTCESTIVLVRADYRHKIVMDSGAKILSGAIVRYTATGWVGRDTCEVTLTGIE